MKSDHTERGLLSNLELTGNRLLLDQTLGCSSSLKNFANSRPSASKFKSFSRSLKHFFLTVGQNNFGNKIPFVTDLNQLEQPA